MRSAYALLSTTILFLTAGLLVYSQTQAFSLDEGFHLLAAQLIKAGKTPYLDFCFPQPPLNTYLNAGLMRTFGDGWRVPHVIAALAVSGAVMLTSTFVFSRFPIAQWRLVCAFISACMVGLSVPVVQFGTVQAYGLSLLLVVAGFRVILRSAETGTVFWPFAAGLLAGAAAASSLLTAPVTPVLLIWLLFYNRDGNRWAKSIAVALGAAIPFFPVLLLFMKAPSVVFFNIVQYQVQYRRVNWGEVNFHDLDVVTAWVDSSPALMIGLLAIAGCLLLRADNRFDRVRRAEFYLSGWLAVALTAYLCLARPTFERYFLLVVPFYAMLACVGLYAVASRFGFGDRPLWPAALVTSLLCLGLAKRLFDDRTSYTWSDYQQIADKVDQVTPREAALWADEVIYFLTRRTPPSGMEFSYSHKLRLPAPRAASLHIISQTEIDARLKAGAFATVATCADDDEVERLGLRRIYAHRAEVSECQIFWGKR